MNGITVLAIDPGNEQSAYVIYDGERPLRFGKVPNASLLNSVRRAPEFVATSHCAIETLKPRGMPTAFEEMQAQFWAGRFAEAWDDAHGGDKFGVNAPVQVFRIDVKKHICEPGDDDRLYMPGLWQCPNCGGYSIQINEEPYCWKCHGKPKKPAPPQGA